MNKEEVMITEREEFIKICGILAYSDTHPADCKYITSFIVKLGKENKELKERVSYLERSNNRREETILDLREECGIVDELRSWLEEEIKQRSSKYDRWAFEDTLDKLNELENGE